MDKIIVNGIVFYGYHGTSEAERELGQKFLVDIEVKADLSLAGRSDKLEDTIDYQRVCSLVKEVEESKKYRLLEALAHDIASAVLKQFPMIQEVMVRVKKPQVPIAGLVDYVAIEIIRNRQ
ncbi:MAG: dihydroneopterin aldolase [bacterium]|nr:dihydroneopterin aldolase [bacterium]